MIETHILGSGLAGQAIAKAIEFLKFTEPKLKIGNTTFLPRTRHLSHNKLTRNSVLCIANPSGLHTPKISEGIKAGYRLIICEKPTSIDYSQLQEAKQFKSKIAVFHVYRAMWGIQKLRELILNGFFGRIVSIEGKLWQSSRVAKCSSTLSKELKREWLTDKSLAGMYGVSLGLGTHWLDAIQFLLQEPLKLQHSKIDRLTDGAGEDDTYMNLQLTSESGIFVSGSVSNMIHGARNDFEINIIGEQGFAMWNLMEPDQIALGTGKEKRFLYRQDGIIGSGQPPFHGVGWLEGYIEILRQSYRELCGLPHTGYPTLLESNKIIELLLQTHSPVLNEEQSPALV